jgi:hypothetical protein
MNLVAVIWVVISLIAFSLPFSPQGIPWESDFDWTWLNYGPVLLFGVIILVGLWWVLSANKKYTGPVRTIEFDEAMRVLDDPPPAQAPGS